MSRSILYNTDLAQSREPYRQGKEAILHTLAYFDVFNYPLNCDEIREFLPRRCPEHIFLESLRLLLEEGSIHFFESYYSLHPNPLLLHRRRMGNRRADKMLGAARRTGRFLYRFPFVKAVGISGSLSKHYADEKADFDFFIITAANRHWIARTLMHLFKKLTYLAGMQHRFCMNYYIDEKALLIPDQNVFTAVEMKTLLPVGGAGMMHRFFQLNDWTNDFLPQKKFRLQEGQEVKTGFFKRLGQRLFGFDGLNRYLYRLTAARWKQKELRGAKNEKGICMGLIAGEHFAKADPGGFQELVLRRHGEILKGYVHF